ncbi:PAS domain-containing protein [Heliorestis acidaminivorans]|uniref:histidine kinase n=1 Tax=Heliorestis acidaminivorans TaxID=553427 RepID=A0A6I0F428_9FIRM|nr:HAMP domain-containing sensor histidine kinase [Heliorestis acidaminivorans]KAB2954510.1 PAS domain-containing protein [Heliorestis acidaminivorans]
MKNNSSIQKKIVYGYVVIFLVPFLWFFLWYLPQGDEGLTLFILLYAIITTAAVYFWSRRIAKIIVDLTRAVDDMQDGSAPRLYGIQAQGELGDLAASIRATSEQLQKQIRDLNQEKNKFETVLGSMVEGVVGFDRMGRILLVNKAAEKMLLINAEIAKGKMLVEVIRNRELEAVFSHTLHTGEVGRREIQIWPNKLQMYKVQVVPVWSEERIFGAVMVIHDITEVRRLEQMRTEFVANVSHELRTPLTSIKGFVETLLDGAVEDKKLSHRFLTIIDEETDRLQRLIEDLLKLSHIESHRELIIQGETEVESELCRIKSLLTPVAQEKEVTLHFEIAKSLPKVPLTSDHLQQVLVNLIENGIKYNKKGGHLFLRAFSKGQEVHIEIEDTGIGIPEDSAPRIFERFYRVDKARSRDIGGTGLGLAIVKHIVEGSGGQITLSSQVGRGTTFFITFPAVKKLTVL